jgi:hypothetical protein
MISWLQDNLGALAERHNSTAPHDERNIGRSDIDEAVNVWLEMRGLNEKAARHTLLKVCEGNDWVKPGAIRSAVSRRILGDRATKAVGEVWVRWNQLESGSWTVKPDLTAAAELRNELERRRAHALREGDPEDLVKWAKGEVPWLGRLLGDEPEPPQRDKKRQYVDAPDKIAAAIAKRIVKGDGQNKYAKVCSGMPAHAARQRQESTMTDIDKAARGIITILAVAFAIAVDKVEAHIDELTRQDMEKAEWDFQQSGAVQKAEALVLWEMQLEGRCAPSVPQAAAIPCTKRPKLAAKPVEHVWTVGPAVKAVR